jgi:hypothetical protein
VVSLYIAAIKNEGFQMKKTPALVALDALNQKNRRLKTSLVLLVLSLLLSTSVQPAHAADRVLQVLGKCGNADALYDGNGKKGRSHLISFAPTGFAGFVLEGAASFLPINGFDQR